MRRLLMTALLCLMVPWLTAAAPESSIRIFYEGNAQFEVFGPRNQRVLIDVYDASRLSAPAGPEDILLTTHPHIDHLNPAFFASFPGHCMNGPGEMEKDGIRIRGIMSSHFSIEEDPVDIAHQNIIYCIDWGGMRIAHFGDNQQLSLTAKQLEAVGRVDIALAALIYDPLGYIDPAGFGPLDQVHPKLIIPAHMDRNAGKHALVLWRGSRIGNPSVTVGPEDLGDETQILFMGENARMFEALPEWSGQQ